MAEQPCRPADAADEHAGGRRVERAGMADLAGAGKASKACDDVMGGHPAGLSTTTRPPGIGSPAFRSTAGGQVGSSR